MDRPAKAKLSVDAAANRFAVSARFFLRLLAAIHLIAFVSFWTQLPGLVGPHGLLPAQPFFDAVREQLGSAAYARLPSLCWLFGAGIFLHILCAAGVVLSLLLFAGIAPALCLALLWASYLSLACAGQTFFNFQWDALLLETTLLAIFLAPWSRRECGRGALTPLWRLTDPPRLARGLLWWLLFRLMFLSGAVKLLSGDPTWRDLTALTFHYETQPLPTPLAWYVHQLPAWFHRACCAGMFAIELIVPFFFFAPRALRHNAVLLTIALMIAISLTGNYTFFNLLTIALCLLCLDDAWWLALLPSRFAASCDSTRNLSTGLPPWRTWFLAGVAVFVVWFTALDAAPSFVRDFRPSTSFVAISDLVAPFRSLNNYGLFAVMTHPRPEIIVEGSDDGREWRAYEFPDKPGDLALRPTWVAPHQPRLDWQLWFAALESPAQNRWVTTLCEHLLRGTPEVLALVAQNPFPQKPPRFLRVVRYEYHFTDAATRARTGQWWRRTPLDFYLERVSLR